MNKQRDHMIKGWWITVSLIFLLGLTSCAPMQEKGMMEGEKGMMKEEKMMEGEKMMKEKKEMMEKEKGMMK